MAQKNLATKILKAHLAAAILFVWLAGSAQAETYRWTDDAGVVHFSDNYDKIPSRFQKRATVESDMSSVNIMPANNAPERATPGLGAAAQARQEAGPEKARSNGNKNPKKHATKGHRKPKQVEEAPLPATTPARQEQNQAEERIRKDRQATDDAQAPARRAQDQAEEQIKKARDGMTGH